MKVGMESKSMQLGELTISKTVLTRAALMVWEVVARAGFLIACFILLALVFMAILCAIAFASNITLQLIDPMR